MEQQNMELQNKELQNNAPQITEPQHSPWRRYLARFLDHWLINVFFMLILPVLIFRTEPDNIEFTGKTIVELAVVILLTLLLEPLFLSFFGTTPGKWALGIRVKTPDGDRLSLSAALNRTIGVLIYGTAGYLPVIELILQFRSMKRYERGETMRWDKESGTEVTYSSHTSGLVLTIRFAAFCLLILALSVGALFAGELPAHHNGLTVEEFADNFNHYAQWYGYNFRLNSDGTWQEDTGLTDETSGGEIIADLTDDFLTSTDVPLTYTVEDGIVTGVSWEEEWDSEDNMAGWMLDYDMLQIVSTAFTRGQPEYPLVSSGFLSQLCSDLESGMYDYCDETLEYSLSDSVKIQVILKDTRASGNEQTSAFFSIARIEAGSEANTEITDGTFYKYNFTVTDVTEEELIDQVGFDLPAPANASNVTYAVVDTGMAVDDRPVYIAEMNFTIEGQKMSLCARNAEETYIGENDTVGEDIADLDTQSGCLTSTVIDDNTPSVGSFGAEIYVLTETEEEVLYPDMGYIAWIDSDSMILYNLSVVENTTDMTTEELLLKYANEIFVPVQNTAAQENAGEISLEDYMAAMNQEEFCTENTDISSDFLGLVRSIDAIECFENGAKEDRALKASEALTRYYDTYAASLTDDFLSTLPETAAEQVNILRDEMVCSSFTPEDFQATEQTALDEFNQAVLDEHPSFESDIIYQQIYSSIQDAVNNLK